ncbi:MAG: V-type ATPase subunit, partial [Firmicutes bacterium]|nr:V-type ATPase subunit [Bacillota bacterium]
YHNAKVILKAEALSTDPSDYLMEGGRVEGGELAVMVKERNFLFTPPFLRDSILEAVEAYGKSRDPQEIDVLLDKACYKEMLAEAEAADNSFVTSYVKLLIDILNVQTFVRVKQIGKPVEFLEKVFLEGGRIDLMTLMELYGESYQQIGEKLDLYGFGEAVGRGGSTAAENGSFALLEKLCDNLKVRYAKGAQFITAGIEPIAAFYVAKEMELKNLRMVLTGKLVGIPEETLKERLREAYV